MDLEMKQCRPCDGGMLPLTLEEIAKFLPELKYSWKVIDNKKIEHEFVFKNFKESIAFVEKVANIAEEEQHHPNIFIFYHRVIIELWTHAIMGLSENDFIIAAKIEKLI